MEYVIWFFTAFFIIYLFYFFTVILQKKRYEHYRKSTQVMYFVKMYKLDVNKIDISKFIKIISFVNSLIIAIAYTIIMFFDSWLLQLLIGFIILILLMLLSYHFIGIYLKKEDK